MNIRDRIAKWLVPDLEEIKATNELILKNLNFLSLSIDRVVETSPKPQEAVEAKPQYSKEELQSMYDNAVASRTAILTQPAIGSAEITEKNNAAHKIDKYIEEIEKQLALCP